MDAQTLQQLIVGGGAEMPVTRKTKVIEYDRCFAAIDQGLLDHIFGAMVEAQREGATSIDLVLRRLPVTRPTRLVMDYDLYETLQEIAKEFRATRAQKG